jgi:hypothetical protein
VVEQAAMGKVIRIKLLRMGTRDPSG